MKKLIFDYFAECCQYLKKDDSLRVDRGLVDGAPEEAKKAYAEYLRLYNEAAARGEKY